MTSSRPSDIFNLRQPGLPIRLSGTFFVPRAELEAARIKPLHPTAAVSIDFELIPQRGSTVVNFQCTKFTCGDRKAPESANLLVLTEDGWDLFRDGLLALLFRDQRYLDPELRPAFALIEENRQVRGDRQNRESRSLCAPNLLEALYDWSIASDPQLAGRWTLLNDLLVERIPYFRDASLIVGFERGAKLAFVLMENADGVRIPHHLWGTGAQQVFSLLGQVLTTEARFVAIEEPECNLRFGLQRLVGEALHEMVVDNRGPSQLFLTSHSPAFEGGSHFFAMVLDERGVPTVRRRAGVHRAAFLGVDALLPEGKPPGELSYVSSDGLVLVPEELRARLNVLGGGDVTFLENRKTGHIELLSQQEFIQILNELDPPDLEGVDKAEP
jgi:hypothetical protein